MSAENSRIFSGGTRPSFISSAKPEMEVSGVFSSCETLAENSRRSASRSSRSVTSISSSTAPDGRPKLATGFAVSCQTPSERCSSASACVPDKAASTARAASGGRLAPRRFAASCGRARSVFALRLPERMSQFASSSKKPSRICSVIAENSCCRRDSSVSWKRMVRFCSRMRAASGRSSG